MTAKARTTLAVIAVVVGLLVVTLFRAGAADAPHGGRASNAAPVALPANAGTSGGPRPAGRDREIARPPPPGPVGSNDEERPAVASESPTRADAGSTAANGDADARRPDGDTGEAALMADLRRARDSDPARAIELAREGNRRFPDSPEAPERTSILIHALSAEGRTSEARGEAEEMVNHAPDSDWVREVEHFTGAHRHRNLRLTADGALEYY